MFPRGGLSEAKRPPVLEMVLDMASVGGDTPVPTPVLRARRMLRCPGVEVADRAPKLRGTPPAVLPPPTPVPAQINPPRIGDFGVLGTLAAPGPCILSDGRLSRIACMLARGPPRSRLFSDDGDMPPPPPPAYFPAGVRGAIGARSPRVVISYPALTVCKLVCEPW